MTSKDIMIVGAGGQGILLISRIFGKPAIGAGCNMRLSEVYGMAQRGGSMVTFVRYGGKVAEPIVEEDRADMLIAFERPETLRYPHFLKKGDVITVNDWRINPITVVMGMTEHPEGIIDRLKEVHRAIMVEVTEGAKKMGAPKAFNVIVLRAAAEHMGFEKEDWLEVIETMVPSKMVEINKKAFETDYALSVQADKSRW